MYFVFIILILFEFVYGNPTSCRLNCPIPLTVDVKCGSNGITYQNEQELLCAKLKCDTQIYLAYNGPCRENDETKDNKSSSSYNNFKIQFEDIEKSSSENKNISSTSIIPVYVTRIPETVQSSQVLNDSVIDIGKGSVEVDPDHPSVNEIEGSEEIVDKCLDDCVCNYVLAPVCGSNEITYGNQCLLQCVQNCKPKIQFHHDGFCGKIFFNRKRIPKVKFFKLYSEDKGILI